MEDYSKKEVLTELFETSYKTLVGQIPIVGGIINTLMFDFSANLKQSRLNNFTLKLKEYFESVSEEEININNILTPDFHDIFESILIKISRTKSEEKIERYKQIVIGQIKNLKDFDLVEGFVEITSKLTEHHISVLTDRYRINSDIEENNTKIDILNGLLKDKNEELKNLEISKYSASKVKQLKKLKLDEIKKIENSIDEANDITQYSNSTEEKYKISRNEHQRIKHDLSTHFLLEVNVNSNDKYLKRVKSYHITEYGKDYIEFIQHV